MFYPLAPTSPVPAAFHAIIGALVNVEAFKEENVKREYLTTKYDIEKGFMSEFTLEFLQIL